MSRPLLVVSVILALYTLTSTLVAGLVALAWHAGVADLGHPAAAARANRLLMLRLLPAGSALLLTLGLLLPAYLAFEPPTSFEHVGPLLGCLAAAGVFIALRTIAKAALAMAATRRLERKWLRAAAPLVVNPPLAVPAFAIESGAPLVALVGVWRPQLVAAHSVVKACGHDELTAIVRHEMGHLRARDNLKRLVFACAPDLLGLSRVHGGMTTAWHHAAEDAADDAATLGDTRARLELAELLVKVAHLQPVHAWGAAVVSPLVDADELDRRVRRLLQDDPQPGPSVWSHAIPGVTVALAASAGLCLTSPAVLRVLHAGVEVLVAAGR